MAFAFGGGAPTVSVDSELPAAGALNDNMTNPTTPLVGACGMVFDGSTWDRQKGDATDGTLVNLGANNDVTVTSGTVTANAGTNLNTSLLATEATLGSVKTAVETIDNAISGSEMQVDIVTTPKAATSAVSAVADSTSSGQLLAANAARLGASVHNDSSARLYIKAGTTASTTDYTVSLPQYGTWEVPFGYTGRIDGIWASDPGDGGARITEYTA